MKSITFYECCVTLACNSSGWVMRIVVAFKTKKIQRAFQQCCTHTWYTTFCSTQDTPYARFCVL